jgi:hypothetical protein
MAGDERDIVTIGAIVIIAAIGADANQRDERAAEANLIRSGRRESAAYANCGNAGGREHLPRSATMPL